jgi:hypothetical protein
MGYRTMPQEMSLFYTPPQQRTYAMPDGCTVARCATGQSAMTAVSGQVLMI